MISIRTLERFKHYSQSPFSKGNVHLNFNHFKKGTCHFLSLLSSLHEYFPNHKGLNLNWNRIGEGYTDLLEVETLAVALNRLQKLERLDLAGKGIGYENEGVRMIQAMVAALQNLLSLQCLFLGSIGIGPSADRLQMLSTLGNALQNYPSFQRLFLKNNYINNEDQGILRIQLMDRYPPLRILFE